MTPSRWKAAFMPGERRSTTTAAIPAKGKGPCPDGSWDFGENLREENGKGGPTSQLTLNFDPSVERFKDIFYDGQSQAAPSAPLSLRTIDSPESFENDRKILPPDSNAGVLDRKNESPFDIRDGNRDRSLVGKFDCVRDQIQEDLPDLQRIALYRLQVVLNPTLDPEIFFVDEDLQVFQGGQV